MRAGESRRRLPAAQKDLRHTFRGVKGALWCGEFCFPPDEDGTASSIADVGTYDTADGGYNAAPFDIAPERTII